MRTVDIISAKRDGYELDAEDISKIVNGYVAGDIPDYQMSAFLMAVCIKGMSHTETFALTRAMVDSGEILDLSSIPGVKVDKHSTGGVGDKTTIVVVPVLASLGLVVPKMSGRGLGFTGGTLDKLESIDSFRTALSPEEIKAQLLSIGAVMAGQSAKMAVADRKMYALRDVTGTVESVPLIASSIMSKKIACGADVILLDVKYGSGAFMPTIESARELAGEMIEIGKLFGRKTSAVLSSMDQPLGYAVGNALEVREALEALHGQGPEDFLGLCAMLAGVILEQAGVAETLDSGIEAAKQVMSDGRGLAKLGEIIEAQGGDKAVCEYPDLLPSSTVKGYYKADRAGNIGDIDCKSVGIAASLLGAGRERKEDSIVHSAGIVLKAKVGDRVEAGQTLAELHCEDPERLDECVDMLKKAVTVSDTPGKYTNSHELIKT